MCTHFFCTWQPYLGHPFVPVKGNKALMFLLLLRLIADGWHSAAVMMALLLQWLLLPLLWLVAVLTVVLVMQGR